MVNFYVAHIIAFVACCIPPVIAFARRIKKKFLILALSVVAAMLLLANMVFNVANVFATGGFTLWLILMIWSLTKKNKLTLRMAGWFLFGMSMFFAMYDPDIMDYANPSPSIYTLHMIICAVAFIAGLIMIIIPQKKNKEYLAELDTLFALKQKGAITDEEYEAKKQELLNS